MKTQFKVELRVVTLANGVKKDLIEEMILHTLEGANDDFLVKNLKIKKIK